MLGVSNQIVSVVPLKALFEDHNTGKMRRSVAPVCTLVLALPLALLSCFPCGGNAVNIVTNRTVLPISRRGGVVRYWYDADAPSQCDVVLILSVGAVVALDPVHVYDTMARYIVEDSSVVYIATDHSPGSVYQVHEESIAE